MRRRFSIDVEGARRGRHVCAIVPTSAPVGFDRIIPEGAPSDLVQVGELLT